MRLGIATLAVALWASIADAATSIASCKGGSYSYLTTATVMHSIVASTTTTLTVRPTMRVTTTRTITKFATKTNFKLTTSSRTFTSYLTRLWATTSTTTLTFVDTNHAVTITPVPITSTIFSTDGFTPAASALAGVTASDTTTDAASSATTDVNTDLSSTSPNSTPTTSAPLQKRAILGALCSINAYRASTTITITTHTTRGAHVTETQTASTTSVSTKTLALGGVTFINTIKTALKILPTTSTKSIIATIIPTLTADPEIVSLYQACIGANLLDAINVSATSDGSDSSSATAIVTASSTTASPAVNPAENSTQVGINTVVAGPDMTVVAGSSDDAAGCCARCQQNPSCAGSYFSAWNGTCNLVVANACPDQSARAGQFYYDDDMQFTAGSGLILSNGNCGQWTFGGKRASKR